MIKRKFIKIFVSLFGEWNIPKSGFNSTLVSSEKLNERLNV